MVEVLIVIKMEVWFVSVVFFLLKLVDLEQVQLVDVVDEVYVCSVVSDGVGQEVFSKVYLECDFFVVVDVCDLDVFFDRVYDECFKVMVVYVVVEEGFVFDFVLV